MRIVFLGTGTFAEPSFEAVLHAFPGEVVGLVTQPDRDSGNKRGSTRQTGTGMAVIAERAGLPILQPEKINSQEGLKALTTLQPDLLVVAAYGQILSRAVLATPKLGAINVHASLLPKYRGASPVAHAILNGETETGVTIIRITPGLDAGEMLARETLAILPLETTGELETRLAVLGAKMCVEVVKRMKIGPVTGEMQDPERVTKAPKMTKEMGQIDWSRTPPEILNHVRAMQPWPTAYTYFHRPGQEPMRIIINRVDPVFGAFPLHGDSIPGTLKAEAGNQRLLVLGRGHVFVPVLELQPAGKKKMTASEFLRGYPVQDGYRFGPEQLS